MTEDIEIIENGIDYEIRKEDLNPIGFYLLWLLQEPSIRNIILYGGSSSGKSYSVAQIILVMTLFDGENTLVMRKVGASISKTIYEDFKVAAKQLGIVHLFRFKDSLRQIVCSENGAKIDFSGLDDPEKIKGISNYKRVVLDEWSEFDEEDDKQIRKRLRGKKGQQKITTFNPIKETHWIKRNVFDVEQWTDLPMEITIGDEPLPAELCKVKSLRINSEKTILNPKTGELETHAPDTVLIQSTYLNNFWVVGSPDGSYGYYDEQCIADFERDRIHDPDYYNVYALGEWGVIRTGSEFFGSFKRGIHTGGVAVYDPSLPIHLSVDNNVLPYISFTFWQADLSDGFRLTQFDEVCAGSPDNTVRKAAKLVAERIKSYGADIVYLHGDASTRAANTFDEEKRSWLDLLIDALTKEGVEVRDCVGVKNPPVAMSGEFINAILDGAIEGVSIFISDECKTSIEDYMSVQKDVNGAILKVRVKNKTTGQSYEEHGHLSDCLRYITCDLLANEFTVFSNRRKRGLHASGAIRYYNPETQYAYTDELAYCMPNINGKFALVVGRKCGEAWNITDASLVETVSTAGIKNTLTACGCRLIILECSKSYYAMARELQDECDGDLRVIREGPDLPRRIAATSDFVRESIRFNEYLSDTDAEYGAFVTSLLDYRSDTGESVEASAALSGFIQAVLKLGL